MAKATQDTKTAWNEAFERLNVSQKQAVEQIEGPVMVIAGPGTGKTQILTLRIARILEATDTAPENVLALTFTESGARAMRERLQSYIGQAAYQVPIHTFHGFADTIIKRFPDAYPHIVGGRPASDLERVTIIETILSNPDYKLLRPAGNPTYYVTPILSQLSELKRDNIDPDRFRELIVEEEKRMQDIPKIHEKGAHKGKVRGEYQKAEKSLAKNKELLAVYIEYQTILREDRLYDYDDMLIETVSVLESNEDVLRELQETYQYLLADEHQDVNGSQNKILDLLASYHENPNIFVVGDEKQAIFRFQGASLENFLFFEDRFPGTTTIALTDNYRSGQNILDTAHSLIKVDEGPLADLRIPLQANQKETGSLTQHSFSHQVVEDAWLCKEAQELIANGISPAEIAVIVRTNREVESFAKLLRAQGVPITASAESDILSHPMTRTVESLLEAVLVDRDERALADVLHGSYWGITSIDLLRVLASRSFDTSLRSLIADKEKLDMLGVNGEVVYRVHTILEEARRRVAAQAPHEVLAYLLEESGLLRHVAEPHMQESARVLRRIYDEIESMVIEQSDTSLMQLLERFKRLREHQIALSVPFISTTKDSVTVMTAHKSKGLEYAHVFIPHLTDSSWGGRSRRQLFSINTTAATLEDIDADDDEKRLFYVALTRAKHAVYLSHASVRADGKEESPSRLSLALDTDCIEEIDTKEFENQFMPTETIGSIKHSDDVVDLVLTALSERGFSATSYNNYVQSPWDYFYRNVLRVPEVQALPMLYGTAVHSVLERALLHFKKEAIWPKANEIKKYIDQALGRLPLVVDDFARLHEKALTDLVSYINHTASVAGEYSQPEYKMRAQLSTGNPKLPEVLLTGTLDRLDFDAEGQLLRVVDYKTGKPRSRNDIEGNTKTSDGRYKRQLTFYALLLSLHEDERFHCRTGVISFVEPDGKGNIREEEFEITEAEIESLREEIIAAVHELASGTFLQQSCDPEISQYCDLIAELQKNPAD